MNTLVLALTTDGGPRDCAVLAVLVAVAGMGFRWLYWPDLRPPKGRHRKSNPVHSVNGTVPEGDRA